MLLRSLASFASAALLLNACGAPNETVGVATSDAQASPQDAGVAVAVECNEGASRACGCDAQVGEQACYGGHWATCYCAPPTRPTNSAGDCLPGTYTGNFLGFAGTPVPFVPVTGLTLDGKPPLVLQLTTDSSLEFALVGSGTLSGSANGLFNFEATIKGTLDCNAKKFTGKLEGSAKDVFGVFIHQMFVGDMTADYDTTLHELVGGKWTLMSRDANAIDGGLTPAPVDVTGDGDWDGKLSPAMNADGGP